MCRGFKSSQAYHFKWRSQTLVRQGFRRLPFFYAHVPEMSIGCIIRHPWAWFSRIFCQTAAQVLPFWDFSKGQLCSVYRHLRDFLTPAETVFFFGQIFKTFAKMFAYFLQIWQIIDVLTVFCPILLICCRPTMQCSSLFTTFFRKRSHGFSVRYSNYRWL